MIKQLVLTNSATEALIQNPRLQYLGFIANAKRKWGGASRSLRKSCCRHKKTQLTSKDRQHILNGVRQAIATMGSQAVQQVKEILNAEQLIVHLGVERGQVKTKTI